MPGTPSATWVKSITKWATGLKKTAGSYPIPASPQSDQKGDDSYLASPALAIEVISNEKTADYVADKIEQFPQGRPLEVWVAHPSRKHLWLYTPHGKYTVHSGVFSSALLGGAAINPDEILA